VLRQLPFACYSSLLALLGCHLLWRDLGDGLPRWFALPAAAACAAVSASFIGGLFVKCKAPRWTFAIAGIATLWVTLFSTAQVTAWSFNLFFRGSGYPEVPLLKFAADATIVGLFWIFYFVIAISQELSITLINVAIIAGALILIRDPGKREISQASA
jgi:hypothetical protein